MTIQQNGSSVEIDGNIKTIADFQTIKNTLDSMISGNSSVTLNIKNSMSITSSVIGYLTKLSLKDGKDLHLNIYNKNLYDLLIDLNLKDTFNVKKV